MILRLLAITTLVVVDVAFGQLVKIITLDRDRRCNGQIVFQKKPAELNDWGNFLNSTSFSEMDCAVKCFQRVPYCRGVRYDHVANLCMYSSKDQGTCFRSPKDDPAVLENSRMFTMYCIECIERNDTWIPGNRRVLPFIPVTESPENSTSPILNPVKPIDLQNVALPVEKNPLLNQSPSLLQPAPPVPPPDKPVPFLAPLPPAPQVPRSGAPAPPLLPDERSVGFSGNITYDDKEYDSNEATSFNSSNFVDSFQSPLSAKVSKPAVQKTQVPLDNNVFPVPSLFSTDNNSSSQTRPQLLQRKTNALFPPDENVSNVIASGSPNKIPAVPFEEGRNGSNDSLAPVEALPPPVNAQILHTFNETSGRFSNSEPKELNVTIANQKPSAVPQASKQVPLSETLPLVQPTTKQEPTDATSPSALPSSQAPINTTLPPISTQSVQIPVNSTVAILPSTAGATIILGQTKQFVQSTSLPSATTNGSAIPDKKPAEQAIAIPVIRSSQSLGTNQIAEPPPGRITGQLNPIDLSSIVPDPSCREEDLLPCSNHIGRDCLVVKPEKCPRCFCPYRSPAKGCSGPSGLNEIARNELIQGKRLCPNGEPATTVFRYQRKIDIEKKFDNCVRTVQPWCGPGQDLFWQMPRFVNDCYYYCYKDSELRERNFFNITTYD